MMVRAIATFVIVVAIAQTQTPPRDPQAPPALPEGPAMLEVAWRFSLTGAEEGPDAAWLVAGDAHVFVSGPRSALSAHDVKDGKVVWTSDETSVVPPVISEANVVHVGPTAVRVLDQKAGAVRIRVPFEGEPLLAFSGPQRFGVVVAGGILAWDLEGTSAWRGQFSGTPITNVVTSGTLLVFGTDAPALVAFDAATGASAWTIPLPARPLALAATAERVYFGGEDGALYSYRTIGEPDRKFRSVLARPRSIGPPLVDNESVYFAFLDNSVRAFGADGGTQRWDQVVESRPLTGPLRLKDSLGIALTNGRVAELSPKTGKEIAPTSDMGDGPVRMLTAVAAPDGLRIYTITITKDHSRTLAAWGRRPSSIVHRPSSIVRDRPECASARWRPAMTRCARLAPA